MAVIDILIAAPAATADDLQEVLDHAADRAAWQNDTSCR